MKIAHILLVHKNPAQVARLVNAMHHPDSVFFIHVDKKVDISAFLYLNKDPSVHFVEKRVNVNWGGFSQVKAIVNCLKKAVGHTVAFEYINVMSGQDYPLKPISHFHDFLAANPNKCFIGFDEPKSPWLVEARAKVFKYHFTDFFANVKGKFFFERTFNKIFSTRKLPADMELVGRYPWFTIDLSCAQYLVDCIDEPNKFIKFFRYCWGSDEILFHTLLYNSKFRDRMVNNNLRYSNWKAGQPRPATLTLRNISDIEGSNAFFARKFDIRKDVAIMDHIDIQLLKQESVPFLSRTGS